MHGITMKTKLLNKMMKENILIGMTLEKKILFEGKDIPSTIKQLDNLCEECKKEDESVSQNLILTGFKICKSCRTSKTVFPI